MKARVQRSDIREQPVSISDVNSLILYDEYDNALFAFYLDFGGVIQYAVADDEDFRKIYALASGGQAVIKAAKVSDLNLNKAK